MLVPAAGHGLLVHEPLLVLAQQDVGVDQRAAAQAAGHHAVDAVEAPDVEQAVPALAGLPEVRGHAARGAREAAGRVGAAALEHDDRPAGLGHPVGRDGSAEPGPDDDDVDPLDGGALGQRQTPVDAVSGTADATGARRTTTMVRHATRLANDPNGPLTKTWRWACSRGRRNAVSLPRGTTAWTSSGGRGRQGDMSGSGVRFTETMRGFVSTSALDDYQAGFDRGEADESPLEFTVTVTADDVDRAGRRPRPRGRPRGHRHRTGSLPHAAEGRGRSLQPAGPRRRARRRAPDALLDAAGHRRRPPLPPRRLQADPRRRRPGPLVRHDDPLRHRPRGRGHRRPGRGQGHRHHPRGRLRQADDDDAGGRRQPARPAQGDGDVRPDVRRGPQRDLRRRLRPAQHLRPGRRSARAPRR